MTSLIDKIELLIKREKTTPERKKDDSKKSSNEILSELFSAFNADPPKIDEVPVKKSKKSKKKHKKEKKKRSRSTSSVSSEESEYSHKRKKRKKSKSKKRSRESRSPSYPYPLTPVRVKPEPEYVKVKHETPIKSEDVKTKEVKIEKDVKKIVTIKIEDNSLSPPHPIPLPPECKSETIDLRQKVESKKSEANNTDSDKAKGKIQIKNLKFSTVFEETVKKAEEEARKRAEKYEEGEYTDSSSSTEKEVVCNSHFPKTSDPGGILKKQAEEEMKLDLYEEEKAAAAAARKSKKAESSTKTSRKERSKSPKRSRSKSRRSTSASRKRHHRSSSKTRHSSRTRHRSSSRSRRRSRSRSRRRSRSRSRHRSRRLSPRHGRSRRSRSPTGVKLADSEKKRLLEVARRNAINMLKNGAVPAGAAALPPHTRNQVMAAIQSGGKSVDELTDFCKHLSKKEALGELSSVSSNDDDMSENEDTLAFHHPFLVKEKAPIVMNIRGGAPLPIKANPLPIANKEELRLQFPVSSGSQHREKASEWVPVSPPKKDMQVAKLNSAPAKTKSSTTTEIAKISERSSSPPAYMKSFTSGSQLTSVPALPAPGPQAYPPGVDPQKMQDVATIVSQKLSLIRKEQEESELCSTHGFGWSASESFSSSLGQFTGTTGAQILTPRELASGTQAWAKKDQLVRAAPVEGGMGMHLLQKMGWTPGQGLGKEGTGTLQPLLLEVKLDTRGLQAKEEVSSCRRSRGMKPQRTGRIRGPAPLVAGGKHPVSLLGEYCSKQKLGPPEYNLCFECGPDHKKNFLFKVKVAGTEYQPAVASANKKQAKADAAQLALQKLGIVT
ncbi:protein SON-like isoform X2 [Trichoplusia ni]|uniref:Protein SON-like isoform X2 n=1 Tax=Trichoplusia ni TaxID=7111 RepID=A0A7E5WS41_TRINI|nr:protein SON-like isoform X2 [Trichoplusia ni]